MPVDEAEAARLLGVAVDAPWADVRRAYRDRIRHHHPDRAGAGGAEGAVRVIEAFRILDAARHRVDAPSPSPAAARPAPPVDVHEAWWRTAGPIPEVTRLDDDTLALAAPADETFRWLHEAAHDIGEVTYIDRSGPILEVLCRFVGEPATSLVVTLQGRANGTEAFCTVESIEARPAPPTAAVVDLLEDALRRRA